MKTILICGGKIFRLFPKFNCFLLLLSLSTMTVFGQGTIKGVISDKSDKTPLISVNIVIKGTTIGTVTDYNGEFVFPLKAGTYTLQLSYIGYETVEETITIGDNQTIELNKELTAIAIMGEEVVITMQARGQLSAVNQQLRSNQIINVVSAERIRELPDENAAQAISRLPGVHLDGSKVVIRGIESKMNKIMINGIEMPSTEQNTRSSDLSIISANMLSGIEVYKTLTPDMDADAIGGIVNLRLREASSGFHSSITAQGSYNQLNQMFGGAKLWGDVSNRFLNNRLGALLNLNYETRNGGDDWIQIGYNEQNSGAIGEAVYMLGSLSVFDQVKTTRNIGGSLIIDYDLPNGQIVFTNMFSHTTPEETLYRDDLSIDANYHTVHLERNKYTSFLLNNSLRLEQQLGIVKLDASISRVSLDKEYDFRYSNRWRKSSDPSPFNVDSITEKRKLVMEPWEIYSTMNPEADLTTGYYETTSIPTNYDEKQWMADLNLQIPLRLSDHIDINFKLGGKYLRKDRNYDEQLLQDYYPGVVEGVKQDMLDWLLSNDLILDEENTNLYFYKFRDNDYQHGDNFMNSNGKYYMPWVVNADLMDEFWLEHVDQNPETTLLVSDSRDAREDYWGWERLAAGYAMAEINLGQRLTIIPGVRFEQLHNEYSAYNVSQNTMNFYAIEDTLTKPVDQNNLLPHLHLRYRITDWWDFRFSYNHTLSRPDYNHAVPKIYYHEIQLSATAGNPYIKPALSENFDANFTFYSRRMGLITLGGYLKRLNDIFYMQPTLLKNVPDTSIIAEFPLETYPTLLTNSIDFYVNSPYTAYVRGLEVEWQSNFSWLRAPFNGIVLNVNYTHVWSETKYMQDRIRYEPVPGSFIPQPVEI
ncbi:MAG: TonB-dependent receptor, partial [Bacteroidales bacterium]